MRKKIQYEPSIHCKMKETRFRKNAAVRQKRKVKRKEKGLLSIERVCRNHLN